VIKIWKTAKAALKALNHERLARRTLRRSTRQSLPTLRRILFVCQGTNEEALAREWSTHFSTFGLQCEITTSKQIPARKGPSLLTVWLNDHPDAANLAKSAPAVICPLSDGSTVKLPPAVEHGAMTWAWAPSLDHVRRLRAAGWPAKQIFLMPHAASTDQLPGHSLFVDGNAAALFYAGRFLLAQTTINFKQFSEQAAPCFKPLPDTLCLGLPEYTERLDAFLSEALDDITYFPGLRHNVGWVGCGMSYKFMIQLAQRDARPWITICEDDVVLPADWKDEVERFVNPSGAEAPAIEAADMFSGLITDLPDDTQLTSTWQDNTYQYVVLTEMTGTVFNVYRRSMYRHVIAWDEDNFNLKLNAVDRHMARKPNLRVAARLPFLAGHKENLDSTLWGGSNAGYVNRFEASLSKINQLLISVNKK
jgi:hypothetical protein